MTYNLINEEEESGMFNWDAIMSLEYGTVKMAKIENAIEDCMFKYGYLPVEEMLRYRKSGGQLAIQIAAQLNNVRVSTIKLRVLKMDDNSEPEPGKTYWFDKGFIRTKRDAFGQPVDIRGSDIVLRQNQSKVRGDKHDPKIWGKWVLDNDCCITVNHFDALDLLLQFSRWGHLIPQSNWRFEQVFTHLEQPKKREKKAE